MNVLRIAEYYFKDFKKNQAKTGCFRFAREVIYRLHG